MKRVFYANTFIAVCLAVFSMSIVEGFISLTILNMFEPELEISNLIVSSTLPLSMLQGLMTPIILQFVIWGENLFLRDLA